MKLPKKPITQKGENSPNSVTLTAEDIQSRPCVNGGRNGLGRKYEF
jgi:hypothetical protein